MNAVAKTGIMLTVLAALALVTTHARAAEPEVETLVENTNRVAYYQGRAGRALVKMAITDSQGRTRTREFIILRRDDQPPDEKDDTMCGEQKFYIYFRRPADLNKMVFMVHKHLDRNDDRWLYLPALDLVKPIAAGDKRTSFVGSHFLYEDVSGRRITDDTHELVETTENYYVLKNTPKKADTVEFAHFTMWVHRKTFVPVRTVYYDKKGETYRTYEALKVETIDGYPTVTKSRMTDNVMGGHTVLEYQDVTYNIGLPEGIFAERYLRSAPRKYLK